MPLSRFLTKLDLKAATAASVRIHRRVVIAPNALEKMFQALCSAAASISGRVHAPVVVLDDKCAGKIVRFHEHCGLIEMAFLFASVANETPYMRVGIMDYERNPFFLNLPRHPRRDPAASSKNRAAKEIVCFGINEHRIALPNLEFEQIWINPGEKRVIMRAMG